MPLSRLFATAGTAALLAAAVIFPASAAELASAQLKDSSGIAVGDADLMQTDAGVLIKLQLKGLKPGEHAFHIHAVGKCEAPFESAAARFDPGKPKDAGASPAGRTPAVAKLPVRATSGRSSGGGETRGSLLPGQ